MLKLIDTLKTAATGTIETNKGIVYFNMKEISNEDDLINLFNQIKDAEFIDIWGSTGYGGSFDKDLINGYNFSHFKFAYIFWDYMDFMYDEYDGIFANKVMEEYQRKYKFSESIVEIVFYLLSLGDLQAFAFAPVYANYYHFIRHLYDLGFNYMNVEAKCNLANLNGKLVIFLDEAFEEYKKIETKVFTPIERTMENFVAILRSMTHLDESRFFNKVKCTVEIRVNGSGKSFDFHYESPYYIVNFLSSLYKDDFFIECVKNLSIYYN